MFENFQKIQFFIVKTLECFSLINPFSSRSWKLSKFDQIVYTYICFNKSLLSINL